MRQNAINNRPIGMLPCCASTIGASRIRLGPGDSQGALSLGSTLTYGLHHPRHTRQACPCKGRAASQGSETQLRRRYMHAACTHLQACQAACLHDV
jgi:hypothetical protein